MLWIPLNSVTGVPLRSGIYCPVLENGSRRYEAQNWKIVSAVGHILSHDVWEWLVTPKERDRSHSEGITQPPKRVR